MKTTEIKTNNTNAVLNYNQIVELLSSYNFPISMTDYVSQIASIINITDVMVDSNRLVEDHPLIDELIGKVVDKLLYQPQYKEINDGSFMFKKSLIAVAGTIIENCIPWSTKVVKYFDENGNLCTRETKYFSNASDEEYVEPEYARLPEKYDATYVMKGSKKQIECVIREKHLNMLSRQEFMVRAIDHDLVYTYANMKFSENVGNVKYSPSKYLKELESFASVTIAHAGFRYSNIRKLDGSGRDYPAVSIGFAKQYGDSFEKFLIESDYTYVVTKEDVKLAKEFIKEEFKVKSWRKLFERSSKAIEKARRLNVVFQTGRKVKWNMTSKEFGEALWICDIVNNIIYNEGGVSSSYIMADLTNSGAIMTAYQFGDEKYMRVANLLGGDKIDTHQLVADFFGISRKESKTKFVGATHGARVTDELVECKDEVYGERFDYIRLIAEYGIKLAKAGVPYVEMIQRDGMKVIWEPYMRNCRVSLELSNLSVHAIMPFTQGLEGSPKVSGLYARMVHSCDSYVLRKIQRQLHDKGIHVKTTLDCYYVRPSLKPIIVSMVWDALKDLDSWFKEQIKYIEEQTGIKADFELPNRELDVVETSNIM